MPKEPVGTADRAAAAEPGAAEAAAGKAALRSTTAATSNASAVRQSAAALIAKISTTGSYYSGRDWTGENKSLWARDLLNW